MRALELVLALALGPAVAWFKFMFFIFLFVLFGRVVGMTSIRCREGRGKGDDEAQDDQGTLRI